MAMDYSEVLELLEDELRGTGMEYSPFKVGWYNAKVDERFRLLHHDDTLAVLLTSTPSMFDLLFKPFLSSQYQRGSGDLTDPIDQCMRELFSRVKSLFPALQIEALHDFELHPATRRPKVLVQTAGHVSGVARYYQRSDVQPDAWSKEQKIYGVCVHPRYGGWFALRGILVFTDVLAAGLQQKDPVDCIPTREQRIELLERFNDHWKDWSYRDVTTSVVLARYSEEQKEYFATIPSERFDLIDKYSLKDSSR